MTIRSFMPGDAGSWPFEPSMRRYCKLCDRPIAFCECLKSGVQKVEKVVCAVASQAETIEIRPGSSSARRWGSKDRLR